MSTKKQKKFWYDQEPVDQPTKSYPYVFCEEAGSSALTGAAVGFDAIKIGFRCRIHKTYAF